MRRHIEHRSYGFCGALLAWLAVGVFPAAAQQDTTPADSLLNQQRALDRELHEQRKQIDPVGTFLDWQWGGWFEYYVFHFDDGIQSQRVLQRPSAAVWTRLRFDEGAHEVFGRMRLSYSYFNPGDEYELQQDWVGPDFDRVWYRVDIGKALRLTEPDDPVQMGLSIGRQDVRFGTGYVLDLPLDSIVAEWKLADFRVTALFGRTRPSYPNIDTSEPVDTHSDRNFYGVQVKYTGIDRHEPFAYAIWNQDHTNEHPADRLQNYSYDTQYFGIGSRGEIVPRLNYWAEGVWQSGRSFGSGAFLSQDAVAAWGWDVGVEYLLPGPMRKRLMAEYMFASGDGDRVFSPTNAAGGNRQGTRDTSFAAFGFRDTGIAAGFVPSNLHIWKVGGSMTPWEQIELLRDLEIGTNWLLFHKHHSRGAISDATAEQFQGFVGWEMDYFINWRLASDVAWTIRWGMFFPGDAYVDRDARSFLLTGVTWSF